MFPLDPADLALQAQYPLQKGQDGSEVILRSGISPHCLALGTGARLGLDERTWQRRRVRPAPPHLT